MDYNEILCQAVDTIIAQRISEISFDRTIACTITDDTNKSSGEYTVTDGSITFEAYCDSDKYRNNQRVYVQIPMGDYSQKKLIIGKIDTEEDKPISYVAPLSKIVPVETLNVIGDLQLVANGELQESDSKTFKDVGADGSCNVLGVRAKFKCMLQDYIVTSGEYGLIINVLSANQEKATCIFSSKKDMFGNPCAYISPSEQEQAYKLNFTAPVSEIEVSLYQSKDFTYIEQAGQEPISVPVAGFYNISAMDIELTLGYSIEEVEDNTIAISTNDNLTYTAEAENVTRDLQLFWFNKDENNKYLGFTDGVFGTLDEAKYPDAAVYYIQWEHYQNNGSWTPIDGSANKESISVLLNKTWASNKYHAVIYFQGEKFISNEIEFYNEQGDIVKNAMQMELIVEHGDNSYDSYPFYGADGAVINTYDAAKLRYLTFRVDSSIGGTIDDNALEGATVQYFIPTISTMLRDAGEQNGWSEPELKDGYIYYEATWSKELKIPYRLKNNYNPLFKNNSIIIKIIDKNGFEYKGSKSFNFSSYGTSGTDYTIIVSDKYGKVAYTDREQIHLIAELYNANYELQEAAFEIDTSETGESLLNGHNTVTISTSVEWVGDKTTISALHPIAYGDSEAHMYQGPVTVVYDSTGTKPVYYDGDIALFNMDGTPVECDWTLEYYDSKNNVITESYTASWAQLTKKSETAAPRFKPSSIYLGDDVRMVLVAKSGDTVLWRQPLIVLQNQYASAILNNWDGDLVIDENNNRILTSMIGAGTKNTDNQFSGVVMGSVREKDSGSIVYNGIQGYKDGAQTFGFSVDGSAFIGATDSENKIVLDDEGLTINVAAAHLKVDGKKADEYIKSSIDVTTEGIISTVEALQLTTYYGKSSDGSSTRKVYLQNAKLDNGNFSLKFADTLSVVFIESSSEQDELSLVVVVPASEGVDEKVIGTYPMYFNGSVVSITNPFGWGAGATIIFRYNGTNLEVVDNGVYSQIQQTSNDITASVSEKYLTKEGVQEKSFSWNLDAEGFYLNNDGKASGDNFVFKCNEKGVVVKGDITATRLILEGTNTNLALASQLETLDKSIGEALSGMDITINGALANATQAATAAQASANAAQADADQAKKDAGEAADSASYAQGEAEKAAVSAGQSETQAKNAADSAATASGQATQAQQQAAAAAGSAKEAKDQVDAATELVKAAEDYANSAAAKADSIVNDYLKAGGNAVVGDEYIISPYIGGGYLNITGNGKQVIVDPQGLSNTEYIFLVKKGEGVSVGIDANGNAIFKGTITASSGSNIGGWNIKDTGIYSDIGNDTIGMYSSWPSATDKIAGYESNAWRFVAGTKANGKTSYNFGVTRNGILCASEAHISGAIHATSLTLGSDNTTWDAAVNTTIDNNGTVKGKMNPSSNGTYSWSFDPINGISMGKGSTPLLTIGEKLWFNGSGTFEGAITATSLELGSSAQSTLNTEISNNTTVKAANSNAADAVAKANTASEVANDANDAAKKAQDTADKKVNADSSSTTYSWKFDPNAGVTMGKGSNNLLTIDSTGLSVSGKVTASSGKIGGWNIKGNVLYSCLSWTAEKDKTIYPGASGTFYMSPDYGIQNKDTNGNIVSIGGSAGESAYDWALTIGNTVGIRHNGKLYCNLAKIAGWEINDSSIYSGTTKLYSTNQSSSTSILGHSTNTWRLVAGSNFGVTSDGTLYAVGVNISGKIVANNGGTIGGFTISPPTDTSLGYMYSGNVGEQKSILLDPVGQQYQGSIGGSPQNLGWKMIVGNHFGVTDTGSLYASSGSVGGWNIESGCLAGSASGTYNCKLFPNGKTISSNNETYICFLVLYKNGGATPFGAITTSGWKQFTSAT